MINKNDKKYKVGFFILILGGLIVFFSLYIRGKTPGSIYDYFIVIGIIVGLIGAFYLDKSKKILAENKRIKSKKDFFKKYAGRGAIAGLVAALLMDLTLLWTLLLMLFLEVSFLVIFYFSFTRRVWR